MRESDEKERLLFFDHLRAFIILLVVVFHVAMGYTTWDLKWWYVNDVEKNALFDLFVLATDVYIMPVLFLIAGYFAAPVWLRKGAALFWRDKVRRIVLPWIGGTLFVAPAIAYSAVFSRTNVPPDYFSFWVNDFFGRYYQQAHFWFLGVLALFFLLFTLTLTLYPRYLESPSSMKRPGWAFFSGFALLCVIPFFIANLVFFSDAWVNCKFLFMIQPVRIGVYLCYFGLGVYAWKNGWFTRDGYQPSLLAWGVPAVVMLFVFLVYRVTFTLGTNLPALVKAGHALAYSVFCMTAAFFLIALFRRFAGGYSYAGNRLADHSYTIYFIHQCVVIPVAYMVRKIELNIWVKFFGVSAVAVVLCFLIAEYILGRWPLTFRATTQKTAK